MSLEETINANTAAVLKLIDALQGQCSVGKRPEKEKVGAKPAEAKPATVTPVAKPVELETPAREVDVAEVRTATLDLLQARGRSATLALLASFGAAKATEVPPASRAKFLADAKALMAKAV